MKLSIVQSIHSSKPMALLLLIMMLIIPLSAHASTYLYTYTGPTFDPVTIAGTEFTSSDYVTVKFIFDPTLYPTGSFENFQNPLPFTISAGNLVISVSNTQVSNFHLWWNPATYQLLDWDIGVEIYDSSSSISSEIYTSETLYSTGYISGLDYAGITGPRWNPYEVAAIQRDWGYPWGTWTLTPVSTPLPATLLLFGSGLLGLVGIKRRKRS